MRQAQPCAGKFPGRFPKGVVMRSIGKNLLCALAIGAAGTPLVAGAADENTAMHSGFQFGAGAGGGELHLSVPDVPGSTSVGGFAYTAFAGYRFNRWSAVEASYLDGGSVKKDNSGASFKTEPHIATATGMGILPINRAFSLFARAGLAHWWYNADFAVVGLGTANFSEKSNEIIWGAGASVFIDRGLLRLEYEQTKTSPDLAGLTLNMRLQVLTLSVVWML
jgi:hypothetical protein